MARVRSLDHIAVAVQDLDAAVDRYRSRLGAEVTATETLPERGVRLAKLDLGGVCIELFQALDPESRLGRSIAKRGEGIHHLAFRVDDVSVALDDLRAAGAPLVDETPKAGAGGSRIAFLRPEALAGVLVELVQPPSPDGDPEGGTE
jgi:methylmalonyl-CoA epimerase